MRRRHFGAMILSGISLNLAARSDTLIVGEVTKVDGPAGTITVKHGPIAELGLTNRDSIDTFRVDGAVMQGMVFNVLRPGDQIKFRAEFVNGDLTITDAEKK